ncbi:IDEAL domain-containing protein [Clostridium sp. MT-14]|uniref:IDEAL domain-containing protein n=1 Tax=Clostridium sp. MT-14 TaxID=3348360 RepID=UPI0035F294F7
MNDLDFHFFGWDTNEFKTALKKAIEGVSKAKIDDLKAMIDLALDIHNKEMFNEYTSKYKKLINNKR